MKAWPHGVIVVPTVATSHQYPAFDSRCGITSELAAWPQSGRASRAEMKYAVETQMRPHEEILDLPVVAAGEQQHDDDRRDERARQFGQPKTSPRGAAAGELGDDRADVGHEHRAHHESGQRTPYFSRTSPARPCPVASPSARPLPE